MLDHMAVTGALDDRRLRRWSLGDRRRLPGGLRYPCGTAARQRRL